jgi:predicted cupin superfamily sugar epimerase
MERSESFQKVCGDTMARPTAAEIRTLLRLEPHPIEGGYFVQIYRSERQIPKDALPPGYSGARSVGTAIYYLLTPDTFSALHKLPGDEIFHFYLGDPVEMLQLRPDGTGDVVVLGQDIASGMRLQHVVTGGVWQGTRLLPGGEYALLGTTMSPGFDYADYETGDRDRLIARYSEHSARIAALTRSS